MTAIFVGGQAQACRTQFWKWSIEGPSHQIFVSNWFCSFRGVD